MGKYCSDCTYFNPKDKKADGYCKCQKTKKYMFGHMPACKNFSNAYGRGWYQKEKLYDDGKKTANKFTGKETGIIVPVLLIILLIILKIFNIV